MPRLSRIAAMAKGRDNRNREEKKKKKKPKDALAVDVPTHVAFRTHTVSETPEKRPATPES
jgi:hypothetical protein